MGVAGRSRHGLASPTFLQYTGPNGAEQARLKITAFGHI
jgi:hypothetical protein